MSNSSKNKKLPWWVELLFVQIGLPDSWLRNFLKRRKEAKIFINENKKQIYYGLMILLSLAYFTPLLKEANYKNECVKASMSIIKNKLVSKQLKNRDEVQAVATSFCNGGNINYIKE